MHTAVTEASGASSAATTTEVMLKAQIRKAQRLHCICVVAGSACLDRATSGVEGKPPPTPEDYACEYGQPSCVLGQLASEGLDWAQHL
eukprot:1159185-Pelagomonas_calceolata.AAC.20